MAKKAFGKYSTLFLISSFVFGESALAQRAPTDNLSNAPVISVGGFVIPNAAIRNQEAVYSDSRLPDTQFNNGAELINNGTHNKMSNPMDFTNESEIHIKVGGVSEFGMKYGAVVELEADVSTAARRTGFNADKAYAFTESLLGRMEFGNNIAANQKMKVGPESFARAAGGINGRYLEYINLPMLVDSSRPDSIARIGNCDGYRVNSNGTITTTGSNCANVKLPRFILIPQSPIAHGGYAKSFYNRAGDSEYSSSNDPNYNGFNKNRDALQLRDGSFGELEDATKISYYSPRISGWQLGLSFTPDTGNSGTSAAISGNNSGDIKNVASWGLNYSNNFGNLGFATSFVGEAGRYEQLSSAVLKRNNLTSYEAAAMLTYAGFTIGGSYGYWGKSLQPKNGLYSCQYDSNLSISKQDCGSSTILASDTQDGSARSKNKEFDDPYYMTLGAAYQFGPVAASVTHINSQFQNNKYSATSFGIDYKMAKGLMPYLEVTKFDFKSNQPRYYDNLNNVLVDQNYISNSKKQIQDNKGYVALVGLLFAF